MKFDMVVGEKIRMMSLQQLLIALNVWVYNQFQTKLQKFNHLMINIVTFEMPVPTNTINLDKDDLFDWLI